MAEFKVDFSNTPFLQAVTARTPALADRPFLDSGQVNRLNWRIEVLLSRNPHL
ncbi:MAG: hypothetical protein GTN93_32940, partial [Anaerolineae bacterium]|nr:hypothetical protein [Anaerolineae bacterium]